MVSMILEIVLMKVNSDISICDGFDDFGDGSDQG